MDSPDSEFGIGLLIGGPLKVLCGVHREDGRCHQEPAHLVQEHLTRCSDSNGNVGNCNDGNVMVVMLMMVMVMVMIMQKQFIFYILATYQSCHPKTLDQMSRPGTEHQIILPINTHA